MTTKSALMARDELLMMGELPVALRAEATAMAPVLEQLFAKHSPLESVNIVVAALVERLAATKRPQSGLASALARGVVAREEMKVAEGGSLSAEEARVVLGGLSKEAVLKRYRKGQLLGWREARQNAVRFPAWQFVDGSPLPGLVEVLAILATSKGLDEWGKLNFFLTARSGLNGERPLDALKRGEVERVKRVAEAYIE